MSEYLLEMQGISKSFSGVEVLKNVQFNLAPGEVHVLAGENGAGKSTLMKILAGVYTDFGGKVIISGSQVCLNKVQDAANLGISVIHQELSLIGQLPVYENIFLGRESSRFMWLDKRAMQKRAEELLGRIGIDIDVTRPVNEYPIGIQQMIEICKALAFDCNIIVMDEPTSALTDVEVEKLFEIISSLVSRGCGIVYISHKMEEIYRIADRITVLRDGRYICTEAAADLGRDALIKAMVGRDIDEQFPRQVHAKGEVVLKVEDFTIPDLCGNPHPVVDNVTFDLRKGEILGIAGLQGSGNSELLNGIFGTYGSRAQGNVCINGKTASKREPLHSIEQGLVLLTNDRKETGLVLGMDIIRNITLASLKRFSPAWWLDPAAECRQAQVFSKSLQVKAASLENEVASLSGGNQQKVALAKWISTSPCILLLDEPTRGIDVGAKHEIYELMNQWTSSGMSIILITSEMPELLAMSDRIIVMHRGRITAQFRDGDGTQEKILNAAMGERVVA